MINHAICRCIANMTQKKRTRVSVTNYGLNSVQLFTNVPSRERGTKINRYRRKEFRVINVEEYQIERIKGGYPIR